MAKRATKLTYNGSMVPSMVDDDGTVMQTAPNYSISGVPARNLTEAEVNALDDETYKLAIDAKLPGGKPLYSAPAEKKSGTSSSSTRRKSEPATETRGDEGTAEPANGANGS